MRAAVLLLALLCAACSGGSPTAPAPTPTPTPTPPPTMITVTGHVIATNGNQPLGGLTAALGGQVATTDGSGTFSATFLPMSVLQLRLDGSAIVTRSLTVSTTSTRDVTVDAISLTNGFDLTFYRELVRDGLERPNTLQQLRRWTRAPQIYLKTIDEAGAAINEPTLASTEQAIREAIPVWTAGQFGASITRGTETRVGAAGWLTIVWSLDRPVGRCGQANVGLEGGSITLFPNNACKCGSNVVTMFPRGVKHELGHAMGYWHTDAPTDVMYAGQLMQAPTGICDAQPSARERLHAAIAYRRPVGNFDPDTDPSTVVTLAPMRAY